MALKKGAFDALNPTQHENHSLEYLPGAPVPQPHKKQERFGENAGRDFTADTRNKPSFIPLATSQEQGMSQGSALNRMATSLQGPQADIQPVKSSGSMQQDAQVSTVKDFTQPHHSVAITAASVHQVPHNGHVLLGYTNSKSTSDNYGMPGHGQISSNIVMYPPSQFHFTQAGNREATAVRSIQVPNVLGMPPVQNQSVPSDTRVVHTEPSTASSLHSPHQQMLGQSGSNTQVQLQSGQSATLYAMPTMQQVPGNGVPQEVAIPHQAASLGLSQDMPAAVPQEDSRLAGSPKHFKKPESIRQGGAALMPSEASSNALHGQQQPSRQVYTQLAPKIEHVSKPRGFAPVSRAVIGALPANHQLRERLQNLANRQKTLTAKSGEQDIGSVEQSKGGGEGNIYMI